MSKLKKMQNLIPDEYQKSIFDVDFNDLYLKGYRVILTDLDNTLVSYDEVLPTKEILELIEKIKNLGFELIITSNNKKGRVKKFGDACNLKSVWWSLKPLKRGFKKALKNKNYQKNEIVVIGDQLLTDVLSGKRCDYYTILIKAIKRKTEKWVTRFNRVREIKKLKWINENLSEEYEKKLKEYVRDNYGY